MVPYSALNRWGRGARLLAALCLINVGVIAVTRSVAASPETATRVRLMECQAAQLQLHFFGENGAAGTGNTSIGIVDTSVKPCWMEGFPEVRIAAEKSGRAHRRVEIRVLSAGPTVFFPAKLPRVVLRRAVAPPPGVGGRRYPAISAGFVILNEDWGGPGLCPEVTSIGVRLPGLTARRFSTSTQTFACSDYISVSPVLPRATVIGAVYE